MNAKKTLTNGIWVSSPTQTELGLLILGHIFYNDYTVVFLTLSENYSLSECLPQDSVKGSWEPYRNKSIRINYGKGNSAQGKLSVSNQSNILTVLSDDGPLIFHRVEMTSTEKSRFRKHISKEKADIAKYPNGEPHLYISASAEKLLSKKEKDVVLHTMMNIHQAKMIWQASLTTVHQNVEPDWDDIRDYLGVTGSADDLPSPRGGRYMIGKIGKPVRYMLRAEF